MPRLARLDTPGLLNHVMIRGIERRKIFWDDNDREDFIERLSFLLPETKTQCYAWSFLSNHAHFLFRSGPNGIASLMRRLLTGYAGYFNRKHRRHGQLFQNRFKSIICQEESYLLELVRYIHLNPLRAKLVTNLNELDSYKFSGHKVLMGKEKVAWQDDEYILGYFAKQLRTARKRYRAYVEKGIEQGRRPDLMGGGLIRSLGGWDEVKKVKLKGQERIKSDQRILGDSEFVNEILAESEEQFSRKYRLKRKGYDFNKVLNRISVIFKLEEYYITGKGRQKARVMARDLLIYWSVSELCISQVDLARRLDITPAAVSLAFQRGENIVKVKHYNLEM